MGYGRYKKGSGFNFGDFTITTREIIASITIIAIMLLLGVLISGKISESHMDKNEIYNKAVKIETPELFQYGMDTNIGNAFVYGSLKAVDTVTYPEIGGGYMYVERIKERYTMHTQTVTKTRTVNGKTETYTEEEVYWSWDRVGSESLKCKQLSFCDVVFDSNKINIPGTNYIDTIKESSHVRYKYYGTGAEFTGTIFTSLKDKTIADNTEFYNNSTIEETLKMLEFNGGLILFWIFWWLLTGGLTFAFFVLENRWLE